MADKFVASEHNTKLAIHMAQQFRTNSLKEIAVNCQECASILEMYQDESPLTPEATEAVRVFKEVAHYLDLLMDIQQNKFHND